MADPTIREAQQVVASALARLLAHDLPAAYWTLSTATPGELKGQVPQHLADADTRLSMVQEWAAFLGSEVSLERWSEEKGGEAWTAGVFEGARLRVWTWLPEDLLPAESPVSSPSQDGGKES